MKLSFIEIDKAVLYVTKNTLVCETAEDARKMAFESDGNYDVIIIMLEIVCFYYIIIFLYISIQYIMF